MESSVSEGINLRGVKCLTPLSTIFQLYCGSVSKVRENEKWSLPFDKKGKLIICLYM